MATMVLVHPGFAGGWVWREVAADLRRMGHDVFTPTLTGLGERAHLASPNVDLDTHVQDIIGVFECEDLQRVVLVGSSSGSMAMMGAAERVPERIARLVYVDTLVPEDGQSWMDLMTPAVATPLLDAARTYGDGWRVPRTDVHPPRWVAQPLRSVTQPVAIANSTAAALPRVYIHCTNKPADWFYGLGPVIAEAAKQAKAKGWRYREMDADHFPMLSAPHEFAVLLHEVSYEDV